MLPILLSTDRRARLLSRGAIVALTLLAACDSDRTTSPITTPATATSQAAVLPRFPSISWIILEENNIRVPVAGSKFQIVGPNGYFAHVSDNAVGDNNPNLGEMHVVGLAPGKYTVCEIDAAIGFIKQPPYCLVTTISGMTTIGPFFNPRPPRVTLALTDEVGNALSGSAFSFTDSLNLKYVVSDNANGDYNHLTGGYNVALSHPGQYTMCEHVQPSGFVMPAGNGCVKFLAHWGLTTVMGIVINHRNYSANWGITDGNVDANNDYVPLAGAKFKVTYSRLSSINVDDNGQNDYDTRPGRIAVSLTLPGPYSICEVQAPANHWKANPPCKVVNVAYGVPASGGWFINPEAQVPGGN